MSTLALNGVTKHYGTVIWYKYDYYFMIRSQLNIDELVKIAENVKD